MKSLSERILALMPDTAHGLSLRAAIATTGEGVPHVRAAFTKLADAKMAKIVKRGNGNALYLVKADSPVLACAVCCAEFERGPKSKRETCSNFCHAALRHRRATPEQKELWRETLSRVQSSPKALARTAAHNKRRWADPEQHVRLSKQNRERARIRREDPEAFERYRAMMRLINGSPEKKKLYSDLRKQWWADPVMRKKMTEAVNASEAVQEYRRNFGEHNKRRWRDPELRAKYTKANSARNTPELRAATSKRMKKLWKDPKFKAKMSKAGRDKCTRAKAVATRSERGWWKRNRPQEGAPA